MKSERYIPFKNYLIAVLLVVGSILLVLYGFSWYKAYKKHLYSKSYLVKNGIITKEIKSKTEFDNVLKESGNEYFILISYTDSKETYNLEKDLKKIITKYNIEDYFYYYNITNLKKDKNYLDEINKSLSSFDVTIKNVPTIIYVNNNTVSKTGVINRDDDNMMDSGDFQKLLDLNQIEKQ